jgi:Uncharacterized conserved protein
MNHVVQIAAAFFGSLGFALLFGLRRRYLLPASLGGLLSWALYLLLEHLLSSPFLACFAASAFSMVYAELLAHWMRSPTTLFVIPAIIPLVPGSSLYYAMSSAVQRDLANAREYGSQTLELALAIAAGMSFVLACRELHTRRKI